MTFNHFRDILHSKFGLRLPGRECVDLELVSVKQGPTSGRYEQFSIVFEGPLAPALPQGTYHLAHATLGAFELFIVPIAQDARVRSYEAVFSRRTVDVTGEPEAPVGERETGNGSNVEDAARGQEESHG